MTLEIPPRLNIAEEFIDRPARKYPERIAILGEPQPWRYREVEAAVNRAGNALRSGGCRPGDCVLVVLPDSLDFIAAFFGAAKIGAIAVPVNSMARARDYAYYARDSGARFAIVHASSLEEFLTAPECRAIELVLVAGDAAAGLGVPLIRWEERLAGASTTLRAYPTEAKDPAFLLYTSGSGGTPKAAVHLHQDMLVTSRCFGQGVLALTSEDRTYSVSKLFFAYGLGNGMYFPFSVGASTLLDPERPRPERVLSLLERYRPTVFFSVPTLYAALLRSVEQGVRADFSSLRLAVSAGEPLPAEIFERFRRKFGVEILDGIGSTEMLHMFISSRPGQARPGSCGVEVPQYDAKIVDESGQPVAALEIGNLWVRGQSAFACYWNKPELTERTKRDEWVLTGDKFFRDADAFYHHCGRADDMMKVAGMWVSPGEVENVLLAHPLVAEAAVVGQPNELGLVHPVAYVVLRDGVERNKDLDKQLQNWVRRRLVSYKCPGVVHFVSELPKTATGKVQRYLLRRPPC